MNQEENQRERERTKLDLALQASDEGVWDWVFGEEKVSYSSTISEFLGYGEEVDSLPHLFSDFKDWVHSEDLKNFEENLEEFLKKKKSHFGVNCRLKKKEGNWCWVRIRSLSSIDEVSQKFWVVGTMTDISRRKEMETKLKEERNLLHTLIENIPLNAYFKDKKSRFVKVNSSTAKRLGEISPEDLMGKTDRDFFDEEHAESALKNEKEIMSSGKGQINLVEHETRKGKEDSWVLSTKIPWLDHKERVKGTFGVSEDITELILTQKYLGKLAEELNEKNKMVEEEISLAKEIQQSFLPEPHLFFPSKEKPVLSIENCYLPSSTLAGDFLEVLKISDTQLGILISDVMGHGIRSSLIAFMLRGMIEQETEVFSYPDVLLSRLNAGLTDLLLSRGEIIFASVFYGVFDLEKNIFSYANAGHPSPLVLFKDRAEFLEKKKNPAIGLKIDVSYSSQQISLENFSRILLFTDGLIEAGGIESSERVREEIKKQILETENFSDYLGNLVSFAKTISGKEIFPDDLCLVAVEKITR